MCLPYIGGKSRIAKKFILPQIPKDIKNYIEPFSGMFWTFFGMELENYPHLERVVYNDLNPLNYNLFCSLKEDPKKVLQICKSFPYQKKGEPFKQENKDFFILSQRELYRQESRIIQTPNFEMAAKHALILSSIFSGANPKTSGYIDLKGNYHSKFKSFINKLESDKWCKKFEKITDVVRLDFEEIITLWDSQDSYFYCDPPYWKVGEGNYYSNHDFSGEDHLRLANSLKSIRGRFSLSYYPFDELREWFPDTNYRWAQMEFSKSAMAKSGKKQTKATEVLVMNY
jgi:DNA adenine methylase